MKNNYSKEISKLNLEYGNEDCTGCYVEHIDLVMKLATLRHNSHVGRLNSTEEVNEILDMLGFEIEIDDVDDVHNIVNPILLDIEREWNISCASHGISALNSNF